ncbi:MAG TPA: hypothetical protein O0X27_05620 [Methanocorpusculum sp.]|nr:hypothetical protein [Methanocorpusculum sp.]
MRRDVLYEYDLPVELLDDISDTEEVLEVFYARSEKHTLLPILFTRERIVWAYPETANIYRVYELQYIDLVSAYAKYVFPPFPILRFTTVDGQIYRFYNLVDDKDDMRGRLITLCGILKNKIGGNWQVWHKKSFMVDEYLLDRQTHARAENIAGLPLCEPPSSRGTDDVFEEKPIPGKGCFESNEVLFSHFPSNETEDVFEEFVPGGEIKPEDSYAGKDAKIARIVEEVEADIQKSRAAEEEPPKVEKEPDTDAVIYSASSGKCDEQQWGEVNIGGDAEILEDTQYLKRLEKINQQKPEYGPEDDDSVVYDQVKVIKKKENRKDEETSVKMPPVYSKEDDDSIIYPTGDEEPVVITPMKKPKPEFESIDSDEKASVASAPRPVETSADSTLSSIPRPAYEIDADVKIAPRQKTPFEEANRDVIMRMPAREIRAESEPRPVFSNQDSLSPFLKASNLQPRPGFDSAAVDKLLDELKHLRDNGVISDEEYKERSLTLFRSE